MCEITERIVKWWCRKPDSIDDAVVDRGDSQHRQPAAKIGSVQSRFANVLACSHPFFVAAWPVLLLFSQNRDEADFSLASMWIAAALGATAVLLLAARLLMGDWIRAALIVTVFNALFFTFGRAVDYALDRGWLGLSSSTCYHAVLLIWIGMLVAAFAWSFTTRRDVTSVSKFLTGVVGLLVVFTLIRIASEGPSASKRIQATMVESSPELHAQYQPIAPAAHETAELPDIYYIILDAYARHDVLEAVFSHDNSPFLQQLESRGFYVARQSCSNYPYTFLSLASSLNMQYFEDELPPKTTRPRKKTFHKYCHRPLVGRVLQSKGYRFIQAATNVGMTERSDYADRMIRYQPEWLQNEFSQVLLRTTPLRIFEPSVAYVHLHTFSELTEIPEIEGPTFTFAHIVCPHRPFVFDCNGTVLTEERQDLLSEHERDEKYRSAYVNQLEFVNKRTIAVIEEIVAKSKTPPIIIIHGDHGTNTTAPSKNVQASLHDLACERLPILNAYLVPEQLRAKLYPGISPVNTFRLLLSEHFGEDFPLLPDRNFIGWYNEPFNLVDATEVVSGPQVGPRLAATMKEKANTRK